MRPKTRYIPEGSTKWESGDCIAYLYKKEISDHIYACAVGYCAKRNKPEFSQYFGSVEIRQKWLEAWALRRKKRLENEQAHKAIIKAARGKNQPHTLKEGDILHATWGYDCIINAWAQVIRVESQKFPYGRNKFSGTETPLPNQFKAKSIEHTRQVKQILGKDSVRMPPDPDNDHGTPITFTKWNGRPAGYDELD